MRNLFLMAIIAVSVQAQAFTFSFGKVNSKNSAKFNDKQVQCVRVLGAYRPITKIGALIAKRSGTTNCQSKKFKVVAYSYKLSVIKLKKRALSDADFKAIEAGYLKQM